MNMQQECSQARVLVLGCLANLDDHSEYFVLQRTEQPFFFLSHLTVMMYQNSSSVAISLQDLRVFPCGLYILIRIDDHQRDTICDAVIIVIGIRLIIGKGSQVEVIRVLIPYSGCQGYSLKGRECKKGGKETTMQTQDGHSICQE